MLLRTAHGALRAAHRFATTCLQLLVIDAREGGRKDALPIAASLGQLAACASTNEGSPFVLFIHGGGDGWVPPVEEAAAVESRCVQLLATLERA